MERASQDMAVALLIQTHYKMSLRGAKRRSNLIEREIATPFVKT